MRMPKVSQKKKLEMEALKESVKVSPYRPKKSPKSIYGSEHPRGGAIDTMSNSKDNKANSENELDKSVKRKKVIWKDNPLKPKPKEIKEPIIVDYLKEFRVKNALEKHSSSIPP
mmetsp:Transcript_524/g.573  ORF Transcript_524/g.573 Transcript_524/m.573 type:complete len:114 (+) Transcript_524:984-1325(+)